MKKLFWAFFGPTCMCKKLRNFGTVPPIFANRVLKCARDVKEKSNEISARELFALNNRRIYIANFAIFKIATFWSYHLHLREKSRSFSFTKLRDFLVGNAHVRSQATVHAFMHAVCMRAEDIDTCFKVRARVASSPEVPKVTWWKIATFLRLPFTLANFAWNFATFQKNRTPAWYFLAMFRECLCVVARQLAPKCRDFSNVAKLARQCKWPYLLRKMSPPPPPPGLLRVKRHGRLFVCGIPAGMPCMGHRGQHFNSVEPWRLNWNKLLVFNKTSILSLFLILVTRTTRRWAIERAFWPIIS